MSGSSLSDVGAQAGYAGRWELPELNGGVPNSPLAALFEFCRSATAAARRLSSGHDRPWHQTAAPAALPELVAASRMQHPITLVSPFEGCDSVAGGVWLPSHFGDSSSHDALLLLAFDAASVELPAHAHEHSDRFIIALKGTGLFFATPQRLCDFDGTEMERMEVTEGTALFFPRGVVHTFVSPGSRLALVSYHDPYLPLDDPLQYSLARQHWLPEIS